MTLLFGGAAEPVNIRITLLRRFMPGELAADVASQVEVQETSSGRVWRSDNTSCSTSVEEHRLADEPEMSTLSIYQVAGRGGCNQALQRTQIGANEALIIEGEYRFASEMPWPR